MPIPRITIRNINAPMDITVPNTGGSGAGGNQFTNWTPSTGNFSSNSGGGSSVTGIPTFNPPGMNIPNVRSQGSGYSGSGSNENTQGGGYSINSNSVGLGKEYHYTEVLGTAGSTARDHNNHCATIAYIIDFCRKQSSHCWGSNALDHPAGGAEGPYHAKAINIGWCDVDDNDMANLFYVLRDFNFNMDIINISGNKVGDHGVACMINGITGINYQTLYNPTNWQPYKSPNLKVTQSVVKIILSNNKIGDHGAKTISDALASGKLPATKEIDVSGNQITQNGDTKIVQALKGVKQDIVVFTRTLDEINKVGGDEGKEAQITALKNIIERGKAIGTYDKAMVVDRSLWGSIKHNIKKAELSYNHLIGFGKCHFSPEEAATSYAQDKIIATLPDKTSSSLSFAKKYAEKLVNFHNIITCFVGSYENSITAELGQEVVKHELCVVGVDEFCGE